MNLNLNQLIPQKYVLNNGMTFVHLPSTFHNIFRIDFIVRTGMFYEQLHEKGYAHFLEHLMCFFPSSKYPNSKQNQDDLQSKGIDINAYTDELYTGYYLQGTLDHFYNVIDLIFWNFIDPVYDNKVIRQEVDAVLIELQNYLRDPWFNLDKLSDKILFENTMLEVGMDQELKNMEKFLQNDKTKTYIEELRKFRQREYTYDRTIVFFTLNCSDEIFEQLTNYLSKQYFANTNINKTPKIITPITNTNTNNTKNTKTSKLKEHYKIFYTPFNDGKGSKIYFVFPLPFTIEANQVYILHYLNYVLLQGMSSLLFRRARQECGLVYNFHSQRHFFPFDTTSYNHYVIETETKDENDLSKLIHIVLRTINELKEKYKAILNSTNDDFISKKEAEYSYYMKFHNTQFEESISFNKLLNYFKKCFLWNTTCKTIKDHIKCHELTFKNKTLIHQTLNDVFNFNLLRIFYSCKNPVLQQGEYKSVHCKINF